MANEVETPAELLEQRAAEQRLRIHASVGELKSSLIELKSSVQENIRERLDMKSYARQHFRGVAVGAAAFAIVLGYGIAGIFTRK
jgi:ElaB/YqjD/DUF883 family membrane-anchored ribosome-binding protein